MRVVNRNKKGDLKEVERKINRSIKHLVENNKVKVGITSNPSDRASKYRNQTDFDNMFVQFSTESAEDIRQLEKNLIKKNKDVLENQIGGGGGPLGDAPHHLYLVSRQKRNVFNDLGKFLLIGGIAAVSLTLIFGSNKSTS